MKKLISLMILGSILSGCAWLRPHKADIEQGNIMSQSEISRLRPGMSEDQVKDVMGSPLLINIFTPNRIEYVYTFQAGYGDMAEKRISCIFSGGRLQTIQRN